MKFRNIDRLGTTGLFLTAILSPCCFPLLALGASAIGLGSFELFGGYTMWIFQAMILISIAGFVASYIRHRCMYPLLVAIPSSISIFYGYHFNDSDNWMYFLYAGMVGLLAATIWNYRRNKLHGGCGDCNATDENPVDLKSTITCPNCKHAKTEIMPTDACVYFYECENCKTVLKPKQGDCCVFCSYGTKKCPPIQANGACC